MNKTFVLVKINNKESYRDFCKYVSAINKLNFQILWNYKFQHFCEISLDEGQLVYIDEQYKDEYIVCLKKNDISFEIKDLSSKYDEWVNIHCSKEVLDDSFYNAECVQMVKEIEIPQIIELLDGTQLLTEEEIVRKDGIKLYTHSNEQCGHHIPHVHVWYNDDKNYCVISLKDFKVIEPCNCLKRAKIKKCVELLKKNINDSRLAWNRSSGNLKFKVVEGIPLDEYE